MKPHFLLILFASTVLTVNQNSQPRETPLEHICGKAETSKCISGGVLNRYIASVELPAYPQIAQEKQIEGTVTVQLIFNEDGEVISATPLFGPEELWPASVKATINTRFHPLKLSGKPIKVSGVLLVNFKNGKMEIPIGKRPVTTVLRHP